MASLSEPESETAAIGPIAPSPVQPVESMEAMVERLVVQAIAKALAVPPAPAASPPGSVEVNPVTEDEVEYPIVYSNPRIIDERFYVIGSPYPQRFVKGRFVAQDAQANTSVRACLEAHGRGFADRWMGEDRREWVCRRTGFRTSNENARYDYETYHED
jgi:hypothetical protein